MTQKLNSFLILLVSVMFLINLFFANFSPTPKSFTPHANHQDWLALTSMQNKKIKKIAILAAHTLEQDSKTKEIKMIDGGAWHLKKPGATVGVDDVLNNYPHTVYSEYRYSRELAQVLKNNLSARGYLVQIFDPINPDRNGFIRQSVYESLAWEADLIITLHTDGSNNQKQQGCFAIIDDRFPITAQNANLITQSLANISQATNIPLAPQYTAPDANVPAVLSNLAQNGGLLNTSRVGLNRLVATKQSLAQKNPPPPVLYLEVGTHSNREDVQNLLTKKNQLAQAISSAVASVYDLQWYVNPNSPGASPQYLATLQCRNRI